MAQDRGGRVLPADHRGIEHQDRVGRLLVGIGDAGELLDQACPRLGVQALAVPLLADLDWGRDVDEQEVAHLGNHLPDLVSRGRERRDRRADRDAAVLGDLSGDIADPRDVQIAVGPGERQAGREQRAHQVAVEQRDPAVAALGQQVAQVPARSSTSPIRTGRSGTARNHVPSAAVSRAGARPRRPRRRTRAGSRRRCRACRRADPERGPRSPAPPRSGPAGAKPRPAGRRPSHRTAAPGSGRQAGRGPVRPARPVRLDRPGWPAARAGLDRGWTGLARQPSAIRWVAP